jgi:hypothetical protein
VTEVPLCHAELQPDGRQTGLALMRNESEENVLSNYVEGLAASGTEAEHGEVIVE